MILDDPNLKFIIWLMNPLGRKVLGDVAKSIDWKDLGFIVDVILKSKPDESVSPGLVGALLYKSGFSEGKVKDFLELAQLFSELNDEEFEKIVIEAREKLVRNLSFRDIDLYLSDKIGLDELINKLTEIKNLYPTKRTKGVTDLANDSIEEILNQDFGMLESIPSSFPFLNRITPWKGYIKGTLNVVGAGPGTGKTTFMTNEAIHFSRSGLKVAYFALGDMTRSDFIIKILGIQFKIKTREVLDRLKDKDYSLWENPSLNKIKENLKLYVFGPGEVTVDDVIAESRAVNADVVIVDYDANLLLSNIDMYERHRESYNKLASLSRDDKSGWKVVIVGSQISRSYWDRDLVGIESLAESSTKQHISDLVITLGKNYKAQRPCGYLNLAKSRRGYDFTDDMVTYVPYEIDPYGRFVEITEDYYRRLTR